MKTPIEDFKNIKIDKITVPDGGNIPMETPQLKIYFRDYETVLTGLNLLDC